MSLDIFTIPDALRFPVAPQYLIAFFVCATGRAVAEPIRWAIYTARKEGTPFLIYFRIFLFNGFLGYLLPIKLGLPARLALLRWKTNLDFYRITSLVAFDAVLTHLYWAVLGLLTLPVISQLKPVDWNYKAILVVLAVVGMAACLIMFKTRPSKAGSTGFIGRVVTLRLRIREAFLELNAEIISRVILVLVFDLVFLVGLHWAMLRFAGHDLPISAVFLVAVIGSFAGVVSLAPLGLGTYDAVVVFMLMQYSLPLDAAIAIPIIYRLGTALLTIPVGFLCGLSLGISPRQREWVKQYSGSGNSKTRSNDPLSR